MVILAPPFPLIFISSDTQVSPPILQTYNRLEALLYTVWIHIQIPLQPSGCGLYCWVFPLHYWPPRDQKIPWVRGTLYICLCILTRNFTENEWCSAECVSQVQMNCCLLQRKGRYAGQQYISALQKQSSKKPEEFKLFEKRVKERFWFKILQNIQLVL